MARTMGIDWGERRVGVAVSDELGWTAQGVGAVPMTGKTLEEVASLVERHEVDRIVVGMPVHDDGRPSKSAGKIVAFVEALRNRLPSLPVETWDESNTSYEANRILRERGVSWKESRKQVDRIAAAVMLQSWLDAHPRRSERPEEIE